jgi:Methyltransferase domain
MLSQQTGHPFQTFPPIPQSVGRDNTLEDYLARGCSAIEGWLLEPAVRMTVAMAEVQRSFVAPGPVCEIGVWQGRYAALLSFVSAEPRPVIAVDCFTHVPDRDQQIRRLHQNINMWFRRPKLVQIVEKNSRDVTADELIRLGGGKFQFISVDGDHTMLGALHDLRLAGCMLAPGGIAAIDDIMNPTCPGVVEAVVRYSLDSQASLAPVAIAGNKLFMTQNSYCDRFRQMITEMCLANALGPASRPILDFKAQMQSLDIPVRFLGQEILVHP